MRQMVELKLARWLVALVLALAAPGCKNKSDAPAGSAVDPAEINDKGGADLLARRDSLLSARTRIREERHKLENERREILSAGGDTTELDKRASQLDAEEQKLAGEEKQLNKSLESFLQSRRELLEQLAAQTSVQNRAAAAQTFMATREKDLAGRETQLAAREEALAKREAALALREKETCGAGGTTTIIQAPAGASRYSKRDVVPMLKRARRDMSRRGILGSDLPAGVQSLEDEATAAMAKGDYGKAHFAATQLVRSVKGIRIDKAFIAAKIGRLNSAIKGKKLSGSADAEVNKLFRQATANFGDGRFTSANRRLNKIYSMIR